MNTLLARHLAPSGQELQIVQGDITGEEVDAIVNAANDELRHGGGVAQAISKQGGPAIQAESDAWIRQHGRVTHAAPAWTSGGRLPARYVIHAVGPVWGEGEEDSKLDAAVQGSLGVADQLRCASLALPAISTGIFGFPGDRAAGVIFSAIEAYLARHSSKLETIRVVLYDRATVDVFLKVWQDKWGTGA